jgi:hypothetical protein
MTALSVHNPEQVRVVDRVDERATLLLSRAEILRSSHAGKIFAWLFGQCGGKAGTVRDVSLSQIVAAVDCSESGARKWLKLLAARGLIMIAERAKRLDPYVIHVLETEPVAAQKTFDFMPEPVLAAAVVRVVRVVRQDVPETKFGNMPNHIAEVSKMVESRAPTVRTNGTHQRYAPMVRTAESGQKATLQAEKNGTEVVAAAVVDDSPEAWNADGELSLAQELLRMRAGALKPQTLSNSSLTQTQTLKRKPLSQETGGMVASERAVSVPQRIGGDVLGVVGGFMTAIEQRLADPGSIARQVQALVAVINEVLPPQKYPTLSRNYVQRAAEVAVVGHARVDQWRPITPSDVERWARRALEGEEPPACFHAKVNKEFKRRLLECPKLERDL